MRKPALAVLALTLVIGVAVRGQEPPAPAAPKPAPRWPDGRISFSGGPQDVGNWEGPANASIFFEVFDGKVVKPRASLPTNPEFKDVPFQPWARDLYLKRRRRIRTRVASPRVVRACSTPRMASRSWIFPKPRK
jgi:hypothetical protein